MEYRDYIKQRESYKISDDLYECPICKEKKSRRGFIQHIWRIHFGMITGGNNGCYHTEEYKNKISKKNHENIELKYGKLVEFDVICHSCNKKFTIIEREKKFPSKKKYFCSILCSHKRIIKESTKKKISDSIFLYREKKGLKVCREKFCRNCGIKIKNSRKFCSDNCKKEYRIYFKFNNEKDLYEKEKIKRKIYRRLCSFKFSLSDFPNEFDFSLISEFGWYSASNRGNNLNGVSRDHMYSIMDGYRNDIDPQIISHPANCELIIQKNNSSKRDHSKITLEELIKRIEEWKEKYPD